MFLFFVEPNKRKEMIKNIHIFYDILNSTDVVVVVVDGDDEFDCDAPFVSS